MDLDKMNINVLRFTRTHTKRYVALHIALGMYVYIVLVYTHTWRRGVVNSVSTGNQERRVHVPHVARVNRDEKKL